MKPSRLLQFSSILIVIILLLNCKKTTESGNNWGGADFTSFVAIGNSLTAGVADGALYEDSQKNSFPNLIAKMADAENNFEQPLMIGNGYSYNETEGLLDLNLLTFSLYFTEAGSEKNSGLNRAYNNLGIPLIRANQLYNATNAVQADSNHFVDKILRGSGNTAIQEALTLNPTLLTLWVGNNDVLEAAALGLADENSPYTPTNEFSTHLTNIVNQLSAGTDAPIFIANIIDITDLPYFTSLPSLVKNPATGKSAYLYGECEEKVIRKLTNDDLILFWALPNYFDFRSNIDGISETTALNDTLVLDVTEKAEIQTVINNYNDIIKNITNSNDQLNLVDMYTAFKNLANNGISFDGVNYTTDINIIDSDGFLDYGALSKSLISLDGLHPKKYGYAYFANTFVDVINMTLNADIPLILSSKDFN
jgi:lysophospholipase L1-like esterase